MKTKFLTLFALSCGLYACSDSKMEIENPNVTPANAVSINLNMQTACIKGRAAVTEGDDLTASVLMCNGAVADWTNFISVTTNTVDGNNNLLSRANTSSAAFKAGVTEKTVTLAPVLYYDNQTKDAKSWLKAVSPKGSLNGSVLLFDTQSGEVDVMSSVAVDAGSHTAPASSVVLDFAHLTTQMNFAIKIKPYEGAGAQWTGKTVVLKSVSLQTAVHPVSFDIVGHKINWSAPAAFTIPGISNITLGSQTATVGRSVMVNAAAETFVNAVLTVDGAQIEFNNIPVMDATDANKKLVTSIGESHLITITVVEPGTTNTTTPIASVTATIQSWIIGLDGSVTLE